MAKIARSMIRIRFLRRITRIRKCLHTSRKWNQEPAAFYCLWLWMYAYILLASASTASSEIIWNNWFFHSLTTHTSPVQESILLLGHPSFCDYTINLHLQNVSLTSPCLHIAFHYSTIYQMKCLQFSGLHDFTQWALTMKRGDRNQSSKASADQPTSLSTGMQTKNDRQRSKPTIWPRFGVGDNTTCHGPLDCIIALFPHLDVIMGRKCFCTLKRIVSHFAVASIFDLLML